MQINEKELQAAVDRLREGDDNGLLVKHHEVISAMATDKEQMELIVEMMLDESITIADELVNELFDNTARTLLIEAKAGLM